MKILSVYSFFGTLGCQNSPKFDRIFSAILSISRHEIIITLKHVSWSFMRSRDCVWQWATSKVLGKNVKIFQKNSYKFGGFLHSAPTKKETSTLRFRSCQAGWIMAFQVKIGVSELLRLKKTAQVEWQICNDHQTTDESTSSDWD